MKKRILITGKNSYVGNAFAELVNKYPDKYEVDKISLRTEDWKKKDFSKYQVVLHVAGIAHQKESKKNKDLFFKVNRDLTYEIAQKAKNDGVNQFIFLSSMSVYGMETGVITNDTIPNPKTNYGKSKLEAEKLIIPLNDQNFKISILRPPMIYGKASKGNYTKLANLTVKTPIFPDIKNQRSMIYIGNLSQFIKILIDDSYSGIFFPQNSEYVCTSEIVKEIAEVHGKKLIMTKIFNPLIRVIRIKIIKKIFGDLIYEMSMSKIKKNYNCISFKDSIRQSELR